MPSNTANITVIVGAQWGDEGKGKITDFFAGESDYDFKSKVVNDVEFINFSDAVKAAMN